MKNHLYIWGLGGALLLFGCAGTSDGADALREGGQEWTATSVDTLVASDMLCRVVTKPSGQTHVQLTNTGAEQLEVLAWGTPWDKLLSAVQVSADGVNARYTGPTAIRPGAPQDTDYLRVAPGQTISTDFDISQNYLLTPGLPYKVSLSRSFFLARVSGETRRVPHGCGEGTLQLDPAVPTSGVATRQDELYFDSSCSPSELEDLNVLNLAALAATRMGASIAQVGGAPFPYWFGPSGPYGDKKAEVKAYMDRYQTKNWLATCRNTGEDYCISGASGVVIDPPNGPARMHICRQIFWTLGQTERMGTLVHEHTHLAGPAASITPGTHDLEYGAVNSRSLLTDPDCNNGGALCMATDNADTYEFYAQESLMNVLVPASSSEPLLF